MPPLHSVLNWEDFFYIFLFVLLFRVSHELRKEARMRILTHINIVTLFAIIFELGHYGIVMEYVLHGALDDFLFNYDVWRSILAYQCLHSFIIYILLCPLFKPLKLPEDSRTDLRILRLSFYSFIVTIRQTLAKLEQRQPGICHMSRSQRENVV